jgi:hypothetical protein
LDIKKRRFYYWRRKAAFQAKKTGFRKEFGDQQGYFFRKFWENFRAIPEFLSALPETGNF